MSLTFFVPPGIGDFSAMYQKLYHVGREIVIRPAMDSPKRMGPFLDILPKVKNGDYAVHSANASLAYTLSPGTDIASLEDGEYFLSINQWLEDGNLVGDWIPGPTEYHYEFDNQPYKYEVEVFLKSLPADHGPLIGIYCSAYGNSRHWGFWSLEEWREFLEMVSTVLPKNTVYLFIGAEYDVQIADYLHSWMESVSLQSIYTLGSFHIGSTVELIRALDYFFVFPSGLGFLADVVKTPNLMWFPAHLRQMMGTFCDPEQYESGRTMHRTFNSPGRSFEEFSKFGFGFLERVYK